MSNFSMSRSLILAGGGAFALLALSSPEALAVPSYARQTGLACEVCHTIFPELTPFGRLFKLNGYTLTGLRQIEAAGGNALKINAGAPLSVMLQVGMSNEGKRAPGKQNNNVEFPRQLSLFYAGEISPHMGTFMQITYEQKGAGSSFQWDNTDVRYANHFTLGGQDEIYGVTLNNNPSVEDVWNNTPAWGFPWIHSGEHPYDHYANKARGAPDSMLDSLAANVAGLGAYTLLNNQWYAALSFYRSADESIGTIPQPVSGANPDGLYSINGLAPYWRLAWQHQFDNAYWEIGTFGMQTKIAELPGVEDKYTDAGVDTQYEMPLGANLLALHAQYLHESQDYGFGSGLATHSSDHLNDARIDAEMHFQRMYEVALGYDNWSGSSDPVLYAWKNGVTNVSGSPDTAYWTAEVDYLPWENTKLGLQYRGYTKYVGSTTSVSNDNYTYLYGWFAW